MYSLLSDEPSFPPEADVLFRLNKPLAAPLSPAPGKEPSDDDAPALTRGCVMLPTSEVNLTAVRPVENG